MPGWGAYVSEADYRAHVATYIDESEVSELRFRMVPLTQRWML